MRRFSSKTLSAQLQQAAAATAAATAAASGLPTVTTTVTAGEAIQAGDVVVQGGDGLAYWVADPTAPGASARPAWLGTDTAQANTITPLQGMAALTTYNSGTPIQLANGNIVVATYTSTGPTTGAAVFQIYRLDGTLVAGPIQSTYSMGTTTANCQLSMAPLPAGGFVLALGGGNQGFPCLERYSDQGVMIGARIMLETVTQRATGTFVTSLANGGVAVAWFTSPGYQPKVAFFDASLNQVGPTLVVGTTVGVNSQYQWLEQLRCLTLANGNVAVVWVEAGGTVHRAIYSQAGAVVAADVASAIVMPTNPSTALICLYAIATTDNGLAISYMSGNVSKVIKYDASGNTVGAIQTPSTSPVPNYYPITRLCPIPGGGVFWGWSNNGNGTTANCQSAWGVYDASMNILVPGTAMNINGSTANGSEFIFPMLMPNGDVTVLVGDLNTALYGVRFGLVVGVWAQKDTGVVITTGTTYYANTYSTNLGNAVPLVVCAMLTDPLSVVGNGYVLCPQPNSTAGIRLAIINAFVQRRSTIGVAMAAAAKGAALAVQSLGAIATRLTFARPFVTDQSAQTPAGQKMTVIGNKALMKGTQP